MIRHRDIYTAVERIDEVLNDETTSWGLGAGPDDHDPAELDATDEAMAKLAADDPGQVEPAPGMELIGRDVETLTRQVETLLGGLIRTHLADLARAKRRRLRRKAELDPAEKARAVRELRHIWLNLGASDIPEAVVLREIARGERDV